MRDLIRIASILGLAVALAAVAGCAQKKQPERETLRETTSADPAIDSEDRPSEPPPRNALRKWPLSWTFPCGS